MNYLNQNSLHANLNHKFFGFFWVFFAWNHFDLTYSITCWKKSVLFLILCTSFTFLLGIQQFVAQHWPGSAVVVLAISWGTSCLVLLLTSAMQWHSGSQWQRGSVPSHSCCSATMSSRHLPDARTLLGNSLPLFFTLLSSVDFITWLYWNCGFLCVLLAQHGASWQAGSDNADADCRE